MSNRKLSKYITEETFCHSDTATALKMQNVFTPIAFNNAVILCQDFYDPILDYYSKKLNGHNPASLLILSSGYRCIELNKKIGGDAKSQHPFGNAGDTNIFGIPPKQLFNDIISGRIKQRNGKPLKDIIDQCIYEQKIINGKLVIWVHIGRAGKSRNQFMQANIKTVNGQTQSSYSSVCSEI